MADRFYGRVRALDLDTRTVTMRIDEAAEGVTEYRLAALSRALLSGAEVVLSVSGVEDGTPAVECSACGAAPGVRCGPKCHTNMSPEGEETPPEGNE